MSTLLRTLPRCALLAYLALGAACSSFGVAPSRPTSAPPPSPAPAADASPAPVVVAPLPPPGLPPRAEPQPPPRSDVPARPTSDASGASGALLEQSRAQRAAGSLPAARASLERALRLEPNNPVLWLELGELELQTGNNAQAATLARKAQTLVGRDARLAARAERLLRAAE
jgi:tetratricopeptide (TPR) repeat protein